MVLAPTLLENDAGPDRRKAPAGARGDCQVHIAVIRCGVGRGIAAMSLLDRAGNRGEHYIPFTLREQPSQQGRDYLYAGITAGLDRLLSLGVRRALINVDDERLVAELEHRSEPHRELTLPYILLGCKLNEFSSGKVLLAKPERFTALREKAESLSAPLALLPTAS
jgi:hypothetical protein